MDSGPTRNTINLTYSQFNNQLAILFAVSVPRITRDLKVNSVEKNVMVSYMLCTSLLTQDIFNICGVPICQTVNLALWSLLPSTVVSLFLHGKPSARKSENLALIY